MLSNIKASSYIKLVSEQSIIDEASFYDRYFPQYSKKAYHYGFYQMVHIGVRRSTSLPMLNKDFMVSNNYYNFSTCIFNLLLAKALQCSKI